MGKIVRIGLVELGSTNEAVVMQLPALVCYRGRTYRLAATANHRLVLEAAENTLDWRDVSAG